MLELNTQPGADTDSDTDASATPPGPVSVVCTVTAVSDLPLWPFHGLLEIDEEIITCNEYRAVVHKLFWPRATNRILKTLGGHTTVKIKIAPQFYK